MLYQKGIDDVKMLSKSETRNVTMNLYGKLRKNALVHNFVVHKLVYQCFYLSFCHFVIFVIFVAKGVEGNAYLLEF